MLKSVRMPELGTTVDEVIIERWLKKEGEPIKRGEPLLVVETDKASMEVESFTTGYVSKILVPDGEKVAAGDEIAIIGDKDDVYSDTSVSIPVQTDQKPDKDETVPDREAIKVSPMVRKLAEKHSIDLSSISGSGPEGLILKDDIMRAVSGGETVKIKPPASTPPDATEPVSSSNTQKDTAKQNFQAFSRIEKATAAAMSRSKITIPHVSFSIEIDATALQQARLLSGKKLSYNSLLVWAVARCLRHFPYLTAAYCEDGRMMADAMNIGVAVARGHELFVPVIKNIDPETTDTEKIEQELQRLINTVQSGGLKQEDISGGRFTMTNLGSFGIDAFTAIINPPEAGILAVGAIKDRVITSGGAILIRPMMQVTLSADHRIVNGVYAAGFLQLLKKELERI